MSEVLFVTWDGGGNLPPAVAIATELARRGHRVRFLGHAQQRCAIEAADFAFQPFTHARPWSAVATMPGVKGTMKLLDVFADRGIGADTVRAAREQPPDLVVIDCLLFGAIQAAERAGFPRAVLIHTLYSQQRAAWSRGMGAVLTRLRGVRPVELWSRAARAVVTTLPEMDPCGVLPGGVAPANLDQTGPVWPGSTRPEPATPHTGEPPLVLVSLSTIYQDGQARALQAILNGLAGLPVRVIVTTGPSIEPGSLRAPANARVAQFVDHSTILPQASLVIGHGGHGTSIAALGHDLPLVIMPMFALGDQPVVGRTLERLGAARVVAKTANAVEIAAAVRALLEDGTYRQAARTLGARIRERDGAAAAADVLEGVLVTAALVGEGAG